MTIEDQIDFPEVIAVVAFSAPGHIGIWADLVESDRFPCLEEAWLWQRKRIRYHKNRRSASDRRTVAYAFSGGVTGTREAYGSLDFVGPDPVLPSHREYLTQSSTHEHIFSELHKAIRAVVTDRGFDPHRVSFKAVEGHKAA